MTKLTVRTSIIFVATAETNQVFRSLREMPAPLRARLQQSTHGSDSATILIADKRGREELARALRQHQIPPASQVSPPGTKKQTTSLRPWLELTLPVALGAAIWFLLRAHI